MRPLHLNLATRPFRNNRLVGSVMAGIAMTLVLATVGNLYLFLHYGSDVAELSREAEADRARLASFENEEAALATKFRDRDFKSLYDRGRFANDMIIKRAFSWTLLFNRLESVVPPEVMMTAIRPNITADGIVIRVDGVAKSGDAFITLQDRLLQNKAFNRVFPISERKLNPSRPEITFAMNFGYIPKAALGAAAMVASATPPGEGAAGAPAVAAQEAGASARAAGATPATAPVAPGPSTRSAAAKGTVGRDGRPRGDTAVARLIAAPGGIYLPPGTRPPGDRPTVGGKRPARGTTVDRQPSTAAAPAPPTKASAGDPRGAGPVPGAANAVTGSPLLSQVVIRREPGFPASPVPRPRSIAALQESSKPASPATRIDLPLSFRNSPVGQIYDALSKAHGVRFQIDPAIDPRQKISAELSGKSLPEAITILERAAGHVVTRQADGLYRVVLMSGGEPIADRPVREETLQPQGGKP